MKFYVLGSLRFAEGDARPITPSGTRDRAFLGELLAHAGHVVSVDHIAEATWPDRLPTNWANAVHVRVSRLRTLFRSMAGPSAAAAVISTQPGAYRLSPTETDADQFEKLLAAGEREHEKGFLENAATKLDQALGLWEGEAFADVAAGECVAAEARRLTELHLVTRERQAEVMLALGAHTQVVNMLKPLTERHPLRETLHGHLMASLHQSGRTAEALAVYASLRSTLAEELGTEPAPHLRTLHRTLLERGTIVDSRSSLGPRSAARPPAWVGPSQLPRDTTDFVPSETMEGLLDVLMADTRTTTALTAITGQGGSGKTTAAVHLAHRLRPSYPDGQLFVGLAGTSRRPVEPTEALAQMLLALGHSASALPDGVEARAACFRDRLKGRRVLTVLDDAADEAQVRDLIPGNAESAVVVTSRAWLTGIPFSLQVEHNRMSPHEAVLLFHRIAGAERAGQDLSASQEVARLCGYLPLALRIAGARLAARPHWSVANLVRRLSNSERLLEELTHGPLSLHCCFAPAYRRLTADDQWLFRELGAYGAGLFTSAAVASLLNRTEADAVEALERLAEARLLGVTRRDGWKALPLFRLPGLAAAYAREQSKAETVAALGRSTGSSQSRTEESALRPQRTAIGGVSEMLSAGGTGR